jgi:predicted enzyme related to lactoylglutathione lyase
MQKRTIMLNRPTLLKPNRCRHFLSRGLLVAFVGLAGGLHATAAQAQVPAVAEPAASQEHHAGKVIFVELVTPDLATAEHFYGSLFGWTFRDFKAGTSDYAEAYLGGRMIGGMVHKDIPAGEHRQPSWLSFIAASDVDAVEKTAIQNGAKVLREPHDVPNRGRQAVLSDPQGAVFAVLASNSGDTPDVLAEPGEWIWSSLITADPDTDAAFYQKLFDYEVFDTPAPDGAEHLTLATENYARASANPLPPNKPNIRPHWLNYVRVNDADAATAKLVALGGRVLVAPRVDRHGGKVAVVADPSGAPFGLLEWPDTESKEVTK